MVVKMIISTPGHHICIINNNITLDFGKCKDSHVGSSFTSLPVLSAYSLHITNGEMDGVDIVEA